MNSPKLMLFALVASMPVILLVFTTSRLAAAQEERGFVVQGIVKASGTDTAWPNAAVRLQSRSGFATDLRTTADANGRFAFQGLQPGSYEISARSPEWPDANPVDGISTRQPTVEVGEGQAPRDVTLWIEPMSVVSGRVVSSDGRSVARARVDVMRRLWSGARGRLEMVSGGGGGQADESGFYSVTMPAGEYYLRFRPADGVSFAPVYYPGVRYAEDAVPIRLPVRVPGGFEQTGLDVNVDGEELFQLQFLFEVPEFVAGVPNPLQSYLGGDEPLSLFAAPLGRGLIRTEPQPIGLEDLGSGIWRTAPLPSGEYDLWLGYLPGVFGRIRSEHDLDVVEGIRVRNPLDPIARFRVPVGERGSEAVTEIEIPEVAKVTVPVRVLFDGEAASDIGEFQLRFSDLIFGGISTSPRWVLEAPDGGLELLLHPGEYRFVDPLDLPAGLYIDAVRSGGRDVLKDGVVIGGAVNPIDVVVGSPAGVVQGVVRGASRDFVPGAFVFLVPPAAQRGPLTRVPIALADSSGIFSLTNLRPGEYRLLAFDPLGRPFPVAEDPAFLRQYELRGELITVDPGAPLTINPEAIPLVE